MIGDFYGRKSSPDQGRSVEQQETEWREDCQREGIEPGRVFDEGRELSASRFARHGGRLGYEELVQHISSGACRLLCLWEVSRESRDVEQSAKLLRLCRDHGTLIRVISHRRTYDMTNRRDWRTLIDEAVDAQDESERISERTRRGKRAAAVAGKPASRLLYGYRRIRDEHGHYVAQVEHEERGPVVREITERILDGESLGAVARDLNDRGVPTATGTGQWRGEHLAKMPVNPAYAGLRVHQGEVFGPAAWPALITVEQHELAKALLRDPQRRTSRGTALQYWLAGVIPCSACGGDVLRTKRANAERRYSCHTCRGIAVKAADLERFVERIVLKRLRDPAASAVFTAPKDNGALTQARTDEAVLRARLAEHYDEAAAGKLSAAGLAAMEARLLPTIEEAAKRVKVLATPSKLRALAGVDIPSRWGTLSPRLKRDVVTTMVDLRVGRGLPGRPFFDAARLGESRWVGSTETWADLGLV